MFGAADAKEALKVARDANDTAVKASHLIAEHTAVCTERWSQLREDNRLQRDTLGGISKFLTKIMIGVISGLVLAMGAVVMEVVHTKGLF